MREKRGEMLIVYAGRLVIIECVKSICNRSINCRNHAQHINIMGKVHSNNGRSLFKGEGKK